MNHSFGFSAVEAVTELLSWQRICIWMKREGNWNLMTISWMFDFGLVFLCFNNLFIVRRSMVMKIYEFQVATKQSRCFLLTFRFVSLLQFAMYLLSQKDKSEIGHAGQLATRFVNDWTAVCWIIENFWQLVLSKF